MANRKSIIQIILISLAVTGIFLYLFLGNVTPKIHENRLVVKGTLTGEAVLNFKDIKECSIHDSVYPGIPSVAYQNLRIKSGWFSASQYGPYQMMVYNGVEKYIVVKCGDNYTIFNCKTEKATEEFYQKLQETMENFVPEEPLEPTPTPLPTEAPTKEPETLIDLDAVAQ